MLCHSHRRPCSSLSDSYADMAKNSANGKYVYVTPSTLPEDFDVTKYDLWEGLKEVTSAHGIPHVTKARGKLRDTPVFKRTQFRGQYQNIPPPDPLCWLNQKRIPYQSAKFVLATIGDFMAMVLMLL